jgi:uncharacterized protein
MLQDIIAADWKEAFKAKDVVKKDALNYMIAQIKNKQIEAQRELQDDEVIALIKKEIKWRQESIDFLTKANKLDDVAVEQQIVWYLQVYLPAMMSVEQLTDLVKKIVIEQGITDFGKGRGEIVKAVMADYKSVVDGKMLQDVINTL